MITIKFYTDNNKYMGWQKFKSFCENWGELKSWVDSGNNLIIGNIKVKAYHTFNLRRVLKHL